MAIRVEVQSDGTSRLITKMASGAGGNDPGKLIQNDSATLTKEQTELFLRTIEEKGFWKLPSRDDSRMGCDGAQWIIEGIKNGTYHFVDRWTPEDGEVREIGLMMVSALAKLKLPSKEIY